MVFISYSSKDYVIATDIKERLRQNNIDCWMAPDSIPGGSDYTHEIPKAIESCDYFLLVLSDNSQKSVWVPKELDFALDDKKTVLPISIDSSTLELSFQLRLSNIQCLDASARFNEIVQLVANRINGKDTVPNASDVASNLPEVLTFYELLGISNSREIDIEQLRVSMDITKSMAVPIGKNDEGELVYLDLHHKGDGPNSLIIGPVGSGKSEFIETVLLSLALHFSEEDVIFNIIDLKGGGIAREVSGIPHMRMALTEWSDYAIDNYLLYLEKEVQNRKQMFKECDVDNIYQYLKFRKSAHIDLPPMPHIIIAVDELAELKFEYPEVTKRIIGMVDGNNSTECGIHIIISTQRPSGIIDYSIVTSVSNRICSSMQEDLALNNPVQGKKRIPGRMYFQSESQDSIQLIQLAYSNIMVDPKLSNITELKDYGWYYRKSQKDALLGKIKRYSLD